ncbi:MAG: HEAT repeat domain-containing protein [Verrucomicrobiota bacterium]
MIWRQRTWVTVFLLTGIGVSSPAREGQTEDQPAREQIKKKKKKHTKRKAKHADRDTIGQLRTGEWSPESLARALNLDASRIGATIDRPTSSGLAIIKALRQMPREKLVGDMIPALEKELLRSLEAEFEGSTSVSGRLLNLINALAAVGKDGHPSLRKAYGYDPMIDLFISRKLGPEGRSEVRGLLENPVQDEYWLSYYVAVLAEPGKEMVPLLLEAMKKDEKTAGKYMRMVLDGIGAEGIPEVAETLNDPDWFVRWSGAKTFEMMGPKAEAVLPALKARFLDAAEDLDVRIAAARAMARIQDVAPEKLYPSIPDLESRLLEASRGKSSAWRASYMKREGRLNSSDSGTVNTHISGWGQTAWLVSAMMTGQHLAEANAVIREHLKTGGYGSSTGNILWIFMTCHSRAERYPGRLEPETEAALKDYFFQGLNSTRKKRPLNTALIDESLSSGQYLMGFNDDHPLCVRVQDFLALSVMKDDAAYRGRTLVAGDTLQERYDAYVRFYREALKQWALYGIQYQLGSSAYTYKTYPHYVNLIELAPDPVIRQRAKMYMDLVMVESAQITISGLRGGTKGRAKRGGLGDRWDPFQAMLYGERGSSYFLTMPAASRYQPPEAAVLLRKRGRGIEPYEIVNDRETYGGKECNAVHYAWCTPEYITGCGMYDPNLEAKNGSMGRWSGVVFRNLAAISLDAYTGEKWNVQHKDVRITQMCSDSPYVPGDTRVVFDALPGKVSEQGGWVFVDNKEAYAAVKAVTGGHFWTDSIMRQMYLNDVYSPVILQTGRAKDYGSFDAFRKAILQAPLEFRDNKVEYHGPMSAKLEFFAMTPTLRKEQGMDYTLPRIDGSPIDLNPEYAYSSPFLRNKAGSEMVTISYGGRTWIYDFGKNTVTDVER